MSFDYSNSVLLEGIISIKAAVASQNREIYHVYADEKKVKSRDRKALGFISFLKANNIEYSLESREYIDDTVRKRYTSEKAENSANSGTFHCGMTHGGFIAFAGDRKYMDFEKFLDALSTSGSYAVYLDGVEDPYNFGYSVRNLFAFGAYGFILPKRNWMTAANIVSRASAGATELCCLTFAPENDSTAVKLIKQHGIDIVCAALSGTSVSVYDFSPKKPFILFIGGEKRGISKEFMQSANSVVHIPYSNQNASYSLPTASAAAIFGSILAMKK